MRWFAGRPGRRVPTVRPRIEWCEDRALPSFLGGVSFDANAAPQAVVTADLNHDGAADLVVVNNGDAQGTRSGVSVLTGNGDGSFKPAQNLTAGDHPFAVAVGDLQGDGYADDLVIANARGNSLTIWVRNSAGVFLPRPAVTVGSSPESVVLGDFNGDGVTDIAVANTNGNSLSIIQGDGDGYFEPPQTIALSFSPRALVVGDFDGDGVLDLAVADFADNAVQVFLGVGDGTFQPPQSFPAGSNPRALVTGDFNGDGLPDLAVADYNNGANTSVSILLGNRNPDDNDRWRLLSPVLIPGGIQPDALGVGDFNGDGNPDLVVADFANNNVRLLLGNGDGNFVPTRLLTVGPHPTGLVVDDFNGDGVPDVAVVNSDGNSVSVLLGNGDGGGTFRNAITVAVGNAPQALVNGDFDGDGIPDLAVVGAGGVKVLLGNGNGTFKGSPLSYGVGINPVALAAADLNGDGAPDLAVANEDSGTVSVLLNDGIWGPGPGAPAPGRGSAKQDRLAASAEAVRGAALARRTPTDPTTAALGDHGVPADPRRTHSAWVALTATAAAPAPHPADAVFTAAVSGRTHARRLGHWSWDLDEVTWSLPSA